MILSRVTATGDDPLTIADLRALLERADESSIPDHSVVRNGYDGVPVTILYIEEDPEEYR